jgi:hypothetical protein
MWLLPFFTCQVVPEVFFFTFHLTDDSGLVVIATLHLPCSSMRVFITTFQLSSSSRLVVNATIYLKGFSNLYSLTLFTFQVGSG